MIITHGIHQDQPFRESQETAYEFITNSTKRFICLSAPTGIGKSIIGFESMESPFWYLCSSIHLEHQLIHDFPKASLLKGRSNYPCDMFESADLCIITPPCDNCEYADAKDAALMNKHSILNFHYFLYSCLPEKSEILTADGIKKVEDVKLGEMVPSLDMSEGLGINPEYYESENQPIKGIQKRWYKGKLIQFKSGNGLEFLFTPNHKIIHRKNYSSYKSTVYGRYEIKRASIIDWGGRYLFRLVGNDIPDRKIGWQKDGSKPRNKQYIRISQQFYTPKKYLIKGASHKSKTHYWRKSFINQPDNFEMNDYLSLLGWYISEGSVRKDNRTVIIPQQNKKFKRQIKELLDKMKLHYRQYNYEKHTSSFMISYKGLAKSFLFYGGKYANGKFIHHSLFKLSKKQLMYLFNALIDGDGHRINNKYFNYATKSDRLKDDFIWLATYLGYRARCRKNIKDNCWIFSITKNPKSGHIRGFSKNEIDYEGWIYNLEIQKNHNYYVGNKGIFILTSNSNFAGFSAKDEGMRNVIIDEADDLENILTGFISFVFSMKQMKYLNVAQYPPDKKTVIDSFIKWVRPIGNRLRDQIVNIADQVAGIKNKLKNHVSLSSDDMRTLRREKRLSSVAWKVNFLNKQDLTDGNWVYYNDKNKIILKPKWLTRELSDTFLFNHGKRFLFMSATLPPKPVFCGLYGFDPSEVDYLELDHPFKIENRRVIYRPRFSLTKKELDKEG